MNSRRTVIIAAALALAALAFAGNVLYLKDAQKRAYKNAQLVKVYVVKTEIPKGLSGDQAISQSYVSRGDIPQEFYPGSAIKDINDIKNKVAINTLPVGAIVLNGQFVPPNQAQVTTAQRVDPGNVAVTVSVDQVHGVAGLLMPGDKVDMIITGKDQSGDPDDSFAQILYQNVKILAIGSKTALQAGESADAATAKSQSADSASGLITFQVPTDAAKRVILAANGNSGNGNKNVDTQLFLALVPPDTAPVDDVGRLMGDDLFSTPARTPYPDGK